MNTNPYEPPKAAVAESEDRLPVRPRAVSVALGLILGGVLFEVLVTLHTLQQNNFAFWTPAWTLKVVLFVLYAFLCHQMAWRRSWPRIVLLVLTLLGFAQMCYGLGMALRMLPREDLFSMLPLFFLVPAIPLAMNLAALHLLYFTGADWFRRREPA